MTLPRMSSEGDSGISRAADRLHGDRHHRLQREGAMQRGQRQHQANGRAVGVGDDKAARFGAPGLFFDEPDVIGVDFGNHQRNVGLHAQRARIGDDRATGGGELRLQFAGDRGIEGGEDNFRRAFGLGGRNRHLGDVGRDGSFQTPARGFGIGPAFRTVGCGQPRHFKPRMMFQHLDESLPDDARGAENSYRKFVRHGEL